MGVHKNRITVADQELKKKKNHQANYAEKLLENLNEMEKSFLDNSFPFNECEQTKA